MRYEDREELRSLAKDIREVSTALRDPSDREAAIMEREVSLARTVAKVWRRPNPDHPACQLCGGFGGHRIYYTVEIDWTDPRVIDQEVEHLGGDVALMARGIRPSQSAPQWFPCPLAISILKSAVLREAPPAADAKVEYPA